MNAPSPVRAARRHLTTSALAVALAGGVAVGVALPATAASAATPAPVPAAGSATPGELPAPAPATTAPRSLPGTAAPTRVTRAPGDGQLPRGGVDTGLGGSQRSGGGGTEAVLPLTAGGVGLGALAGFGVWRRRRAGARG
ncbi:MULTISPECIES: hypothetical protein [unclassified Pseudofrankia]|uniref:hypothetical protein n=1 Tax=unclassified Pseudofrankia TaxID=2994372 RepID=UPI0008D90B49|nr:MULTISPECIES: hypothetical protein [unclassified Pseudofrankia]MDT3438888.1 hypothetical protein [Pseudofrankia sp. BMG5.37]OHV74818.1 hypothetical protein BCD48_00530 [Pseudofrankia sp. BMG5.36]